tara:strand:+ start:673 stop:1077 length:405 start_codon:yes stop_codon:yes gene_type:complete
MRFKRLLLFICIVFSNSLMPNIKSVLSLSSSKLNTVATPTVNKLCSPYLVLAKKSDFAINFVQLSTRLLANFDSVGQHVLHANEIIINYLISNHEITMELKKPVILALIHFVQNGDNTGSLILENYYNAVNCLL